jgi:hypothetical protein
VLVDNNIFSFIPQPSNGIHVPSFYDSKEDNELDAVLQVLEVPSILFTQRMLKPTLTIQVLSTGNIAHVNSFFLISFLLNRGQVLDEQDDVRVMLGQFYRIEEEHKRIAQQIIDRQGTKR